MSSFSGLRVLVLETPFLFSGTFTYAVFCLLESNPGALGRDEYGSGTRLWTTKKLVQE